MVVGGGLGKPCPTSTPRGRPRCGFLYSSWLLIHTTWPWRSAWDFPAQVSIMDRTTYGEKGTRNMYAHVAAALPVYKKPLSESTWKVVLIRLPRISNFSGQFRNPLCWKVKSANRTGSADWNFLFNVQHTLTWLVHTDCQESLVDPLPCKNVFRGRNYVTGNMVRVFGFVCPVWRRRLTHLPKADDAHTFQLNHVPGFISITALLFFKQLQQSGSTLRRQKKTCKILDGKCTFITLDATRMVGPPGEGATSGNNHPPLMRLDGVKNHRWWWPCSTFYLTDEWFGEQQATNIKNLCRKFLRRF